ncbi:RAMP superfamily CRISPR-associated protein [Thiorhodospira sibirica]|uniref:RAMP superfamily CRISPR-associated protein n=1 Tax=Thiorhodospira sibirica TaxID=154347 RepID=UPI00022C5885|nr:RAMP superfamily CRISPR-associated protein [Thiorhodospira sibirica]
MTQVAQWMAQLQQASGSAEIVAHFEVVTPMFIGDGEQIARDVRPPSLKGALRFWWRALRWGHCLSAAGGRVDAALRQLHHEEAVLFGLAVKGDQGGQGMFSLTVEYQGKVVGRRDANAWKPGLGTQYLLGQGLWHFRDRLLRDYLPEGGQFVVRLRPHRRQDQALWASLEDALLAFGLFGGLGSRARRGLGSVSLIALEGSGHVLPKTRAEYLRCAQRLFSHSLNIKEMPPFTACSAHTRLDVSNQGKKPLDLLEAIGGEFQLYRAWGNNGKVGSKDAERNFALDHHEALRAAQGELPKKVPQRVVFGLPHNYFFSGSKAKVDISVHKEAAGERRASALLMHVHRLCEGDYLGVQVFMPAAFLPGRAGKPGQLKFKPGRGREMRLECPDTAVDWKVVHRFLDRFTERSSVRAEGGQGGGR